MMSKRLLGIMCLLLCATHPFAWAQIPASVQADLLQREIVDALDRNDRAAALWGIDKYRLTRERMPLALLFVEATLTAESDPVRAEAALSMYFSQATRSDTNYEAALRLYPQVKERTVAAERDSRDRAQAERKHRMDETLQRTAALLRSIEANMVTVAGGTFDIGDTARVSKRHADERPTARVTLKSFRISKYEVTNEQFANFLQATETQKEEPSYCELPRCPVTNVSWNAARAFVAWLNEQSAKQYRLPSEAEWEFAARAGTKTAFWWGSKPDPTKADLSEGLPGKGEVGSKSLPNGFGLYDMIGSAPEWVEDCSAAEIGRVFEGHKFTPKDGSPQMTMPCRFRYIKGNGWAEAADPMAYRVSNRAAHMSTATSAGFRIAHD